MARKTQDPVDGVGTPEERESAAAKSNAAFDRLRVAMWEANGRKKFPTRQEAINYLVEAYIDDAITSVKGR